MRLDALLYVSDYCILLAETLIEETERHVLHMVRVMVMVRIRVSVKDSCLVSMRMLCCRHIGGGSPEWP